MNHEILVLNVPMASFSAFVADLQALLTLIKQSTGKIFVPICLSHSPVAPQSQFIIVLRTSENIQSFSLTGWFTPDIPKLSKKFVTKAEKIDAGASAMALKVKLTKQLVDYYKKEGLCLIGGFQDSKNQLQLLFYKLDNKPTSGGEIFAEVLEPTPGQSPEQQRESIESLVNQAHLDTEGILRCVVSIGQPNRRSHMFIFSVEPEEDHLYMIMKFPESLQDKLAVSQAKAKPTSGKPATAGSKPSESFDELTTRWINAQEHKIGKSNAVNSLVINDDFATSCIVTTP